MGWPTIHKNFYLWGDTLVYVDENNAPLTGIEGGLHNPVSISVKRHYFHHHLPSKNQDLIVPGPKCRCLATMFHTDGISGKNIHIFLWP